MFVSEKILDNLVKFCQNGGLIDSKRPPKFNEPFYEKWMNEKISHMGLKMGDKLKLVVKEHNNEDSIVTGILIDDSYGVITLLTNGKKLWKSRENEKRCFKNRILQIEKIEDAPMGFECKVVNPYYRTKEEIDNDIKSWKEKKQNYHASDIDYFRSVYPEKQFEKCKILHLAYSLYFPYSNGKVTRAKLSFVTQKGVLDIPDYKIKQVHPNKNYYTICGMDKKSENLLVVFSDMEELSKIEYISCLWNVEFDGGIQHEILQIVYPEFKEHMHEYNIYNVISRNTMADIYEEGLLKENTFSGAVYTKYDFVGIMSGDTLFRISGNLKDKELFDATMAENEHDLQKVISDLGDRKNSRDIELYITHLTIESESHFSDNDYMWKQQRIDEKVDFSSFLN